MSFITLNNGQKIPSLGFGTATIFDEEVFMCALKAGYRHFDCASFYRNETVIGSAFTKYISYGGIKREDLFIASKLWNDDHAPVNVKKACLLSLKSLGLTYLDLYLIHWPMASHVKSEKRWSMTDETVMEHEDIQIEETWQAMEGLVMNGLVRSIGVSNFNKSQLQRILNMCAIKPVMNQVELNVNWTQAQLVEYCHSNDIHVTAYAPFGSPGIITDSPIPYPFEEDFVKAIAEKHGRTPGQVLLRHALQRGLVVIVKSSSPKRIESNFQVFDFELTNEEMQVLNTSGRNVRLFSLPSMMKHPEYPFHAEN